MMMGMVTTSLWCVERHVDVQHAVLLHGIHEHRIHIPVAHGFQSQHERVPVLTHTIEQARMPLVIYEQSPLAFYGSGIMCVTSVFLVGGCLLSNPIALAAALFM
jgi:hypothetical protein